MRNRRTGILIVFLLVIALFFTFNKELNAQIIHDPNDQIYQDIDKWAAQGYFDETLPFIRPYPSQLLERLLNQVIERGRSGDQDRASRYKKAVINPDRYIHVGAMVRVDGLNKDVFLGIAPSADGVIPLKNWLRASYTYSAYAANVDPRIAHNVPGTWSPYPDMRADIASIGSFDIMHNWSSSVSVGNAGFYFQAGLNRTSFGPFYNNGIVVGPQAAKAGHFSLNFRQPKWSFELMLLELVASNNLGGGSFPNKHMIMHSINFRPIRNLEFSFIESVVWGNRFEFLYIIPFTFLFAAQAMSDFEDNSFMGINVRWAAFRDAQILFQLYVDDTHFNDLIRLKFNSKHKIAGELGGIWAPKRFPVTLAADYTLVLPYTYSHETYPRENRYGDAGADIEPAVNYNNYSHLGKNLGPELEPNSDRFSLRAKWQTLPDLELRTSLYFTRHANASEGIEGMINEFNNGTIFDDGWQSEPPYTRKDYDLRFLIQDTIDTRLGWGLGASWSLPVSFGVFSVKADYVLEYGWNRALERGDNGFNHYWSFTGSFRW